jgi:hypothetical protein
MQERVINLLKHKGLSRVDSLKVMLTPKTLGGLGWSDSARFGLRWRGGDVRLRSVEIVSEVYTGGSPGAARYGALSRLGALMPLPVDDLVPEIYRAAQLRSIPSAKLVGKCRKIQLSWRFDDSGPSGLSPWQARLESEWMIARGRVWSKKLVPDARCRNSALGSEPAYRFALKWGSQRVNLDTHETTGECWAAVCDYANRWWGGFISYLTFGAQGWWKGDMSGAWASLAKDVAATAFALGPLLPIRV